MDNQCLQSAASRTPSSTATAISDAGRASVWSWAASTTTAGWPGLDFEDTVAQSHDVKSLDSDRVRTEALARGRLLVEFTDQPVLGTGPAELQDPRTAKTFDSVTDQLS
jgi:hypothetical protein